MSIFDKFKENKFGRLKCLNALELKILALILMLCDHMWSTVIAGNNWLTYIGRLAFPIFAFQIVEGFYHTGNFKNYLKRMFVFALISELPFNLMAGGGLIYPMHQNVMFTFCLSLLFLKALEKAKEKGRLVFILATAGVFVVSFFVGFITFVDYYGYGIWMVLIFYLSKNIPFGWLLQLAGMIYINWYMIGGLVFQIPAFGRVWQIPEQGLAVLALIPIWLYNGKQGPKNKALQYGCYIFYPLHILILALIARFL